MENLTTLVEKVNGLLEAFDVVKEHVGKLRAEVSYDESHATIKELLNIQKDILNKCEEKQKQIEKLINGGK